MNEEIEQNIDFQDNEKTELPSFESKIEDASKLLEQLIDPHITLSKSVEVYKKGMASLEEAQKLLDEAKMQFEQINSETVEQNS